jgi:hypothetical protein
VDITELRSSVIGGHSIAAGQAVYGEQLGTGSINSQKDCAASVRLPTPLCRGVVVTGQ